MSLRAAVIVFLVLASVRGLDRLVHLGRGRYPREQDLVTRLEDAVGVFVQLMLVIWLALVLAGRS